MTSLGALSHVASPLVTSATCLLCLQMLCMSLTSVPAVRGSVCERIRIPACRAMPYNVTQMPNLLHHSTQTNAQLVFEQYQLLIATNCSEVLLFFLCSLFTPVCPTSFKQDVIPPCRAVCDEARRGCEPVLIRHNHTWPVEMDCSDLPPYERGVCISPEAIKAIPSTPKGRTIRRKAVNSKQDVRLISPDCRCDNVSQKSVREAYTSYRYHYVFRATFRQLKEVRSGGPFVLKLFVRHVYKSSNVSISTSQTVSLWVKGGCVCKTLRQGADYLVMGHEDVKLKRLLFDFSTTVTEPWKKNWPKNLEKWEQHMQKLNRKSGSVST